MILSVCVPTFNRATELRRFLSSVDLVDDIEIVICDDGSTDNTQSVVSEFSGILNIRYCFQQNSGVSAAMRQAYGFASGRFVIKMDSDDMFKPGALRYMVDVILNHPSFRVFAFGVETAGTSKPRVNMPPPIVSNLLSLKADHGVVGDIKEVAARDVVLRHMYQIPIGTKRVPPSLLWVKIAEHELVLCKPHVVALKYYLPGGITDNRALLEALYPLPMIELYERISLSKAYKSTRYRWRARVLWGKFVLHHSKLPKLYWWSFIVAPLSALLYCVDYVKLDTKLKSKREDAFL